MNRLKGLDLKDRVPEKIWIEVQSIVQGVVISTIPKKNKCKRNKGDHSKNQQNLKLVL